MKISVKAARMMNYLADISSIKNRFFVMRHGESEANQQGIIVSAPEHGIAGYGLTAHGQQQVRASIASEIWLDANTRIYSSDFKRALQTAQIVHQYLHCQHAVQTESALRERFFGDYELTTHDNYARVWQRDAEDANQSVGHVEAANNVMTRATELIIKLDQDWQDQNVLLVAHGDVLQFFTDRICPAASRASSAPKAFKYR